MRSIKLFENKKIRSVWNEKEQKWYFSVQDTIQILTNTIDVKDYIKKMKKRDEALNSNWGTICPLVERQKFVTKENYLGLTASSKKLIK